MNMKPDRRVELKEIAEKATQHKPRTTTKPKPVSQTKGEDGKRITSYLHTEELNGIMKVQSIFLSSGLSAPSVSTILGASIRMISKLSEQEILEGIKNRPDRRK